MLLISCSEFGRVLNSNGRSKKFGFVVGDLLTKYLADTESQRTWMQVLVDLASSNNGLPSPELSLSDLVWATEKDDHEKKYYLSLRIGELSFQRECSLNKSTKLLLGIPSHVDDRSILHQKFMYDMNLLDERDNAVIATDSVGKIYMLMTVFQFMDGTQRKCIGHNVMDIFVHESNAEWAALS